MGGVQAEDRWFWSEEVAPLAKRMAGFACHVSPGCWPVSALSP
jgi:hypothetical protein